MYLDRIERGESLHGHVHGLNVCKNRSRQPAHVAARQASQLHPSFAISSPENTP